MYDNRCNERKSWEKRTCDTSYMDRYVRVLYTYLPFSVSYRGTNYVVVAYSININRRLLRELEHFRHAIKLFSAWFTYDASFIWQIYFLFIVTFKEEIAEGFFTRSLDRAPGNWLNVEFLCKLWFVARADGDLDDAFKCVFLLRFFPIDRSPTFKYLQKIPFLHRMNSLLHFSYLKKRKKERQGNREIRISYIIFLLIIPEKCCNLFSIKMVQFFCNVKGSWKPIYDMSGFTRNDQISGKTRTIRKNVSYGSCMVSSRAYFSPSIYLVLQWPCDLL